MKLAVIKTGGKQYLVAAGDTLKVEKIPGKEGDSVSFDALLVTDDQGEKVELGKPILKSKVAGTIVKQAREDKITVIKYKSKTRYNRKLGHRQSYTSVKIDKV
jgi:large subunit ribosomal protein L21